MRENARPTPQKRPQVYLNWLRAINEFHILTLSIPRSPPELVASPLPCEVPVAFDLRACFPSGVLHE